MKKNMKELADYGKIVYANPGTGIMKTQVILLSEDEITEELKQPWPIGEFIKDLTIERDPENNIISIVSRRYVQFEGGWSHKREFVKNMKVRPDESYIKKDIFGREYVKGTWFTPKRFSLQYFHHTLRNAEIITKNSD